MRFWPTVERASRALGTFLSRRTGEPAPVSLTLRTCMGVELPLESPDVLGLYPLSALPDDNFTCLPGDIARVQRHPPTGAEEGKALVVVYESGVGLVAARAKVQRA